MEERVLLAEDEARMRTIVRDYFQAHGVGCDLAKDGAEALELLRQRDYDVVCSCPRPTALRCAGRCGSTAGCPFYFSPRWGRSGTCSGAMRWGRTTT